MSRAKLPFLHVVRALTRGVSRLVRHLARQPGHLARVLARLATRAKARRQDKTETRLP